MFQGTLISIHIAPGAGAPVESRVTAEAIAGRGLRGDRYFAGIGHWSSSPGVSRDLTMIEIEAIEALGREKNPFDKESLLQFAASGLRRNLVTRGVPLNHLVGSEFQIGEVRVRGTRLCEPCHYLESLTGTTLFSAMVHRAGLRCDILTSGTLRVGNVIATPGVLEPAAYHQKGSYEGQ
jgi:MOSC domain-containing protein YiiM